MAVATGVAAAARPAAPSSKPPTPSATGQATPARADRLSIDDRIRQAIERNRQQQTKRPPLRLKPAQPARPQPGAPRSRSLYRPTPARPPRRPWPLIAAATVLALGMGAWALQQRFRPQPQVTDGLPGPSGLKLRPPAGASRPDQAKPKADQAKPQAAASSSASSRPSAGKPQQGQKQLLQSGSPKARPKAGPTAGPNGAAKPTRALAGAPGGKSPARAQLPEQVPADDAPVDLPMK